MSGINTLVRFSCSRGISYLGRHKLIYNAWPGGIIV